MFSSRSFMVPCLIFKSLSYFEFIIVYDVREWSSFINLHVADCPAFQYFLLKRLSFLPCKLFSPLWKVNWPSVQFSSVQSLSPVRLFATPWISALQASLSTSSRSLLKPMSIELVMPSNHLILCCPLLLLPPIPPSIKVFSNESTLCKRWPKYWSFSFSISPSSEYPGLISFRMDWLDLVAIQGTLKSLLQHKHPIYVQKHQFFGHKWVYFWILYSVPLIHMSVFVPRPHYFDYCNFVLLSEFWEGFFFF